MVAGHLPDKTTAHASHTLTNKVMAKWEPPKGGLPKPPRLISTVLLIIIFHLKMKNPANTKTNWVLSQQAQTTSALGRLRHVCLFILPWHQTFIHFLLLYMSQMCKKFGRCLQQSVFILHQQLEYFPFRRLNFGVRKGDGE